jgi:hypothetical protein
VKTHHKSTSNVVSFFDGFDSVSTRILLSQMTVPLWIRRANDWLDGSAEGIAQKPIHLKKCILSKMKSNPRAATARPLLLGLRM